MDSDQLEGAVSHEQTKQSTNNNETMSTKSNDTDDLHSDEEHYDWHGLPQMIGHAIIDDDFGVHAWGGYLVRKDDDGSILIYREVDVAPTREELETEGDYVAEMYDHFIAGEDLGYIGAPEDGWGSEVRSLPESIFDGFE